MLSSARPCVCRATDPFASHRDALANRVNFCRQCPPGTWRAAPAPSTADKYKLVAVHNLLAKERRRVSRASTRIIQIRTSRRSIMFFWRRSFLYKIRLVTSPFHIQAVRSCGERYRMCKDVIIGTWYGMGGKTVRTGLKILPPNQRNRPRINKSHPEPNADNKTTGATSTPPNCRHHFYCIVGNQESAS